MVPLTGIKAAIQNWPLGTEKLLRSASYQKPKELDELQGLWRPRISSTALKTKI
jgi:hypothetical protein